MFRQRFYFSNNSSFYLAEYVLSETLRKKCASVSPNCQKGAKSSQCSHDARSLKTKLNDCSISEDVRFFYNFIRIFLRQQHLRSSTALFQVKGSII